MNEYIVALQRTWLFNSQFGPSFPPPLPLPCYLFLCSTLQGSTVPRASLAGFQAPWNGKALVDMGTGLGRSGGILVPDSVLAWFPSQTVACPGHGCNHHSPPWFWLLEGCPATLFPDDKGTELLQPHSGRWGNRFLLLGSLNYPLKWFPVSTLLHRYPRMACFLDWVLILEY